MINKKQVNNTSTDRNEISIIEKIKKMTEEQFFGILCTQNSGQPYGSMISFAFSEDLKYVVFATPKATRKYQNLIKCQNIALVVDNRDKYPLNLMKIEAFTATGKAEEITSHDSKSECSEILLNKQTYLKKFLESPTTALFRVKIVRYFHVSSFQELHEWIPE